MEISVTFISDFAALCKIVPVCPCGSSAQ